MNDKRSQIEEPGMLVSPETFKSHLELIRHYFEIIHLSEWLRIKNEGRSLPPKACAITFDDGWADNYQFAFPILQELETPATIFLVSDMIGTKRMFWPERLSRIIYTISENYPQHWSHPELAWLRTDSTDYRFNVNPPNQEEISILISNAKAYTDDEIHTRLDHLEDLLQLEIKISTPSLLDWQQIAEMSSSGLIEAGSHTCHHTRLNANVPEQLLRKEIINSKQTIENQTGNPVHTFCFPNGDFSPQALKLVKQQYIGAVTTCRGWNNITTDNFLLQRIGIHQDISQDKTAFLARISGWL